ncbi:MAG: thioredoxin [Candidatus Symbiothrix sp.]|jgi:thioredoxin|nr:thioredoxin [Candidatus Symbiothrix sp.]
MASCNGTGQNKQDATAEKSATKKPVHLSKSDFLAKVADYETHPDEWQYLGDKPALIDFYADWCGPCKAIAPILEELAEEYKDKIYIYKIDTDEEEELAAAFGIQSIPSLVFIPMGEEPQMSEGSMSKSDLKEAIDSFLLKNK